MRQHVLRTKDKIWEECGSYAVENPQCSKGRWRELFAAPDGQEGASSAAAEASFDTASAPLYVEIGSGKGQFITRMAQAHPDRLYLACEGAVNICPRILQKAQALKLPNLRVITEYIVDPADYFASGELSGVYLNFSDPWPKDRHAHRRLTHVKKLLQYKAMMAPGTTLEFKTDNDPLFDFSLEQAALAGLETAFVTRDLHASPLAAENITTEYEDKFAATGKSINYMKIVF